MSHQALILRLPARLARRLTAWIDTGSHGYESLSEFAAVALSNQLELEGNQPAVGGDREAGPRLPSGSDDPPLGFLVAVEVAPPDDLAGVASRTGDLFVLTNRLSPIKIACRVLANMRLSGGWPDVRPFQMAAAKLARELGIRLRHEDEAEGRKGFERRWVAYPVGADETAATARYISSFTMRDRGSGPLQTLGLATVRDSKAVLTDDGWALAVAASPLLDGSNTGTLGSDEVRILRSALQSAPQENEAVRRFLSAVARAAGPQPQVDELLGRWNPDWTQSQVQSFRSAQVGRLRELGLIQVFGRGPAAKIDATSAAFDFLGQAEETA